MSIYDTILDEKKLRSDLIFCSLFIMIYENFIASWKEEALGFYADSYEFDNENQKVICKFKKPVSDNNGLKWVDDKEKERQFNKNVYQLVKKKDGKHFDKTRSLFKWMENCNFISTEDYLILSSVIDVRNKYAHELFKCLNSGISQEELDLFKSFIEVRKKASETWIREVEMTTSEEGHIDENGNLIEPEWVASIQDLIFDVIIQKAMEDTKE